MQAIRVERQIGGKTLSIETGSYARLADGAVTVQYGESVVMGAVYAALERLERNGLVSSSVGDPTPARGGRAKRFFEVTTRGVDAVKQTQNALVALWTDLPQLKERPT